ncbi:hypothetical protein CLPUN_01250 [Clostridium puniceum]|uniref:ABC-2 family transporter protein n=1 Tax=Clostridium puniceum TaxID=29367 RepID=A0A1S8TX91_9CLOT|nr:hypothetical protein CLPUN_01250 [Clostridium puniceum]
MNEFFRRLISNLKFTFFLKRIYLVVGIFILIFLLKLDYMFNCINSQEYINAMFFSPNTLTDNVLEVLIWSIYQFYLIYIIGDYIYKEFKMRNIYILCRIGSKRNYIVYLYLNILLICLLYYLMGISIFFILTVILNKQTFVPNLFSTLDILFTLVISGCFLSTIYLIIFSSIKNHIMSFIFTIVYVYLGVIIKDNYNINLFISLNLDFFWRIFLYTILIVNLIIISKFIIKEDMTNYLS